MPRTTIRSEDITDAQVKTADMAVDPTNASNLSSGSVPLAQLGNAPATDVTGLQDDIALLAFKTQANGSLARYNLVDQSVDAFEDASGISASDSTNEIRNASNYYSGGTSTAGSSATFTTVETTSWSAPAGLTTVTYLVVAGGGQGGWDAGGGGGAGGYRASTLTVSGGSSYTVTVGIGGVRTQSAGSKLAQDGGNSVFSSITSTGGGGGGGTGPAASPDHDGLPGGSGGGGGGYNASGGTGGAGNAGGYTPVEGYIGGAASNSEGGGGGGSSGAGQQYATIGPGTSNSITGSAVTYAAGGLGVADSGSGNIPGGDNTGDGGSGGGGNPQGGAGGSGIVIVKWDTYNAPANLTLVSNSITAQAAPTKADLVFTYTNGVGTAVLGTNITAEASMDGGSTWTNFSISASDVQGTTGGHTIVTKNNVTLTSTSGTAMRYRIKTLVQSASLETRIQAVSLGWS